MTKYKIAYIDDDEEDIRTFKFKTRQDFEVIEIDLKNNIEELIQEIIEQKVFAVIVDFALSRKKANIHFDGVDIFRALDKVMMNFPSFVLTSYQDDAENKRVDINKIYSKEQYNNDPKLLNKRICRQIENYLQEIDMVENELISLIEKKSNSSLSIAEEEYLIELDEFLEKSINHRGKLPKDIKKTSNEEKLNKLIDLAQKILKEVKQSD